MGVTLTAIAGLALALVGCAPTPTPCIGPGQSIAIPSYFYPGALWTRLEQAHPTVGLAIINPNNGPGTAFDQQYAEQVRHSQEVGLRILGYVPTRYGQRPSADVEREIDAYYAWYGVDGIFLDETSRDCTLAKAYYTPLNRYIKAKNAKGVTVLNPGVSTNECYMAAGDILVTFEGDYAHYASASYAQPSWVQAYAPGRFWHLIYAVTTPADMRRAVTLSRKRHAGWIYVTPATVQSNIWKVLPPDHYWQTELTTVRCSAGTST
jgi:hypothetical protein